MFSAANNNNNSVKSDSLPPVLINRIHFEKWRVEMIDWLRRHKMWKAIFEKPSEKCEES
jgi:hypothetical protein